jgi:hypothetical protein
MVNEVDPIDNRLHEVTASTMTLQGLANANPDLLGSGIGGSLFNLIDVAQGYVFDPILAGVVSRKTHGSAGPFDLDLLATSGIECRTGGVNGNHQIVETFAAPVTFTGVTTSCGSVSGTSMSGNQLTIDLTGVPNASRCSITVQGVTDGVAAAHDITVPLNFLVGDINADGFVNAGDTVVVRAASGSDLSNSNFRNDVNLDGLINAGDTVVVRNASGTALP